MTALLPRRRKQRRKTAPAANVALRSLDRDGAGCGAERGTAPAKKRARRAPFFCRGRSSSSVQHYAGYRSRFFSILRILSQLLPPSTWSHVERECRLPSLAARSLVGVPQTERQCPPPGTSVPMSDAAVASSVRIFAAFRVRPLTKFELSGRKISSPSNSLTRSVCRLKNFKDLGALCSLRPKTTNGSFRSCAVRAVNAAAEANPRLPFGLETIVIQTRFMEPRSL